MTAAIGVAVGLGRETSAVLGTVMAFLILAVLPLVGSRAEGQETRREDPDVLEHDAVRSQEERE